MSMVNSLLKANVSRLGFGLIPLELGTLPLETKFAVLDRAIELGCTHWDSADAYGPSEDTLGAYFKARPGAREKVFLATKFATRTLPDGSRSADSSPEYCLEAIEKSLKRLGVPFIDLYYCHRTDTKTPIEKTVGAMAELKRLGKIKHIGLSEISAATLKRASSIVHIDAIQMEYSPFAMEIEDPSINLLKTARELGIAVVAYSPLGRGMLTGQYRQLSDLPEKDSRRMFPRFSETNFPKNIALVETLETFAKAKGCTVGQLTLARTMAQGDDIFPIPGTKRIEALEENAGALKVKLTSEEVTAIRAEIEKTEVFGERYPAAFVSMCFTDTPEL